MAAAVDGAIGGRIQVPGTHGKHQMFEFLSFELIVHDSAGGVVFRVVTWIITVIIGAVRALCPRCARAVRKRPHGMCRAVTEPLSNTATLCYRTLAP